MLVNMLKYCTTLRLVMSFLITQIHLRFGSQDITETTTFSVVLKGSFRSCLLRVSASRKNSVLLIKHVIGHIKGQGQHTGA